MAESTWKRRGHIQRVVFRILKDHPAGLPSQQVIKEVARRLSQDSPEQNAPGASYDPQRFTRFINSSTTAPAKAGWLVKNRGLWSLTEEGLQAYQKYSDPDEFAEEANRLYNATKQPKEAASWWRKPGNVLKGLVAIVAAFTTLWTFGTWAFGKYESWRSGTLKGRIVAEQEMLNKLTANVDFSIFTDAFGMQPQVCNEWSSGRACTFTRPFEYVKVMLDENNKVLQYAVTVHSSSFKPTLKYWNAERDVPVVLGETTVAEALEGAEYVVGFCGASRSAYYEAWGGFHAVDYRYYTVGVNFLGVFAETSASMCQESARAVFSRYGVDLETFAPYERSSAYLESSKAKQLRGQLVVNTFAETAPDQDPSKLGLPSVEEMDIVHIDKAGSS